MSAPFSTLQLSIDNWDLMLDSSGNIAIVTPPYAVAQDVASAIRTFLGEVFYNTTLGVPYTQQILGQAPPLSVIQAAIEQAAMTVPGVENATAIIDTFEDRVVTGRVEFTDSAGNSQTVGI